MRILAVLVLLLVVALVRAADDPARIMPVAPFEIAETPTSDAALGVATLWPAIAEPGGSAATAVAVAPDQTLYVLHRAGRPFGGDGEFIPEPVIVRLDTATGKVLGQFGAGLFVSPHGMAVGENGDLWIADTALNAVLRLDAKGKLIRRYGDRYPFYLEPLLRLRNLLPGLPVPMGTGTFARPTDVALLSGGRFAVSDGYRNSRVAVFDSDGGLVWEVNRRGSEPGSLYLPHGLSSDRSDRIYVADRRNARIQVFSREGRLERVINSGIAGRPFAVEVGPDGCLYVADGGDSLDGTGGELSSTKPPAGGVSRAGFAVLTLEGQPLLRVGNRDGQSDSFLVPHDIAADRYGRAYIADIEAGHVRSVSVDVSCGD